jgi:cytochrome c-type biogenesis protein
MSEYVSAFWLGNAAILTNACLLPLYPGMIAFLAGGTSGAPRRRTMWLGVPVLGGVISFMLAIGFTLYQLQRSTADLLGWILPVMYTAVIVLGAAMIAGRNPFQGVGVGESPILRNAPLTAFVYGMFLAPMTLPCTGPIVVSAFVVGGVAGSGALSDSLTYFVAFALGFGWPLVALPLVALPLQRRAASALARHHRLLGVIAGLALIATALRGLYADYVA